MVDIPKTDPIRTIGVLLYDGFALMSFAALTEPMRAANHLAGRQLYTVRTIPADGVRAISSGGASIEGTARLSQDLGFDTVFVVAGGDSDRLANTRALNWLRRLSRRGVTLGGISGGAVVLVRAGLMTNRRLTIHSDHYDLLRAQFPDLLLERSSYVFDRDRLTCAGGTAPMDLIHEMIGRHHGTSFARQVSDWFSQDDLPPTARPVRAGLVERYGTTNNAVIICVEAMENTIAEPLSLGQLAAAARVSPRQLNRLCVQHLNKTTMAAYRDIRLDKARAMLMQSTLSVMQVARAAGFSNPAHFATAFSAKFGTSPTKFRTDTQN